MIIRVRVTNSIRASVQVSQRIRASVGVSGRINASVSVNGVVVINNAMSAQHIRNTYIAGENLGGQRVVMIENGRAYYFQPADENNVGKQLGITVGAATTDNPVQVVHWGSITDSGFAIVTDEVYYAQDNGLYSTTPRTSGISQRIGVATASNTMLVQFSEPVIIWNDPTDEYVTTGYVNTGYTN